jgi:hypothetical protein
MNEPTQDRIERVRRFLLGIADLLELWAPKLREFAQDLAASTTKRTKRN